VGPSAEEFAAQVRRLEQELSAVWTERTEALEHATVRHGAERRSWEEERVLLLQQLAQAAAGHAEVTRLLEQVRAVEGGQADEIAATALARDAALRRLAHDADLHAVALMEAQESTRDALERLEECRRENEALHQQVLVLQGAAAHAEMTAEMTAALSRAAAPAVPDSPAVPTAPGSPAAPAHADVLHAELLAPLADVPEVEPEPEPEPDPVAARTVLPALRMRRGRSGLLRR
jgi:hypothetical protein